MFVNAVKNKYMKLNELILSIFILCSIVIHSLLSYAQPKANALENSNINFEGKSEEICLTETFKDTPLVKNNTINIAFFLSSNNPIRTDAFTLPYEDFAYLTEIIMAKSIKYSLNGKVTKITVNGNSKQAKVVLTYSIDTKDKNFLIRLAGIKEDYVNATIYLNVDLNEKKVTNSFEVKGVKLSNFLLKTACKIIFGESDYNKIFDEMSQKLFWGLGNLVEFGENELIFDNV